MNDKNLSRSSSDILVVDDVLENRKLLVNLLTQEGYKVRPASSGAEAMDALKRKNHFQFNKVYYYVLGILFLFSLSVNAQQQQISGKVTESGSGSPILGVNVIIKGTTIGTITDMEGAFNLNVSEGGILLFSFIGYTQKEVTVTAGQTQIDVSLEIDVTELSEVIITGLASSIVRSNLANSIESVKAEELAGVADQTTLDGALYGKLKGANITSNSGAPGGGMSIKLRGVTSIGGNNQPLYIIDGVYIDNSSISPGLNVVSAASGVGNQSNNQDNPSNRIADIDPQDIETIEVLKGASAAAIYGSRASAGVVVITTKKGKEGKVNVTLAQSVGVTQMLNPLGVREWDATKAETHYGVAGRDAFNASQSAGTLNNYEDELYGNKGLLYNTRVTVSGGNAATQYFVGATRRNDEGIVENTGYTKHSFRANLDQKISDWMTLAVNNNFVHSSADRGFFNNDNSGTTMGISFVATPAWAQLQPNADGVYPINPYAASNFIETRDKVTNNETINRYIGGVNAKARLYTDDKQSFSVTGRAGIDYYTLATTALFPNTLQFQSNGNGLNGVSVQGTTVSRNTNFAIFLLHDITTSSNLSFRTQFGLTNENFFRNTILGTASDMSGDQTNLDQGANVSVDQIRREQHDKGFFAQEEVNFNDQVIATLGVRGDKSSNNGDVNKMFYYPKASLAVNIHEFSFWGVSAISQFKVRGAYGEAGNFAVFGSKYTSLANDVINGSSGAVTLSARGNPTIGPERQKEFEVGTDLGFLDGRLGFNFTYYVKSVNDLLLLAQVPLLSGFTSKILNAADMQNKGIEMGLNWNVMNKVNFNWDLTAFWWRNNSEITRLDVPAYTTGGFADYLGQFMIKQGYSPTTVIGVGPNLDVDLNDDGTNTLQVFGNAEADFNLSLINQFNFYNFDITMLWHWKQGGENVNITTLLSDLSGTSPDYDKIDLDPEGATGNGDYRSGEFGVNSAPYIEDAGYIRMRELGIYYNIPRSVFSDVMGLRLGFSGNNLINIFEYSSYDPEVSNFGGNGLSTGVDVTPFPSSKRYNFHVIANF